MIPTMLAYDSTGEHEPLLPLNIQAAGYDTQVGKTAGIQWLPSQFARHTRPYPAVHIDQDPRASDFHSDILDVEAGAATDIEVVNWLQNARHSYLSIQRPGQRWPGIYCSESNVHSIVQILVANAIRSVPFWVADYSIDLAEATRRVANALGPYPAIGYQFNNTAFNGEADTSVFAVPWLALMSALPPVKEKEMIILEVTGEPPASQTFWYTYDGTSVRFIPTPEDLAALKAVLPVAKVSVSQLNYFLGEQREPQ